ncbi:Cytochrome P450 superfamily protein [Abortiporus biennis]
MWLSWTGDQNVFVKSLHDRYGPVVRIGPNEVSIADVDAVTSVLGASGLPKGQYYDARRDPNAPGNLISMRGEDHANRRRLWNRGMSTESLKHYEEVIANRAQQLVEQLQSSTGPVDLARWIGFFTFDFMGDMAFGGGFTMLEDGGDRAGLWEVLERFAIMVAVVCHIPWASQTLQMLPAVSRDIKTLRKVGIESATNRIKSGSTSKDLWYHLSDEAGLEKVKPPMKNVIADGALAIIAGADTTASAMASLFYLLLSHPEYYKLLREEVDTVFPPGEDPLDTSKHNELTFMNACINETLRLQPPVPTSGPRVVPRDSSGKVIADRYIPPGTQVYVPPYSLHRDPRYFSPSPERFMPERWLDPKLQPNANAFIPFSYGPANCVGKQLAKQEMLMVTSLLIQKLDIDFAIDGGFNPRLWPERLKDYFVTIRDPLMVKVTSRQ